MDELRNCCWIDIDTFFFLVLFTMGAHNLKYFCLVKLFAGLETTSHLILDQLLLLFWQIICVN